MPRWAKLKKKLRFTKDKSGKKIKIFERPKGWEKNLKRSHFDESRDFTGKKLEEKEEKKDKKEKKSSLLKRLFGKS